ncbi:MAG: hypothetical protein ACKVJK_12175 [Methylophagaceae bacterium]
MSSTSSNLAELITPALVVEACARVALFPSLEFTPTVVVVVAPSDKFVDTLLTNPLYCELVALSPVFVPEVFPTLVFSAAVIRPAFVPSANGMVAFVPVEEVTTPLETPAV